MQLLLIIYKQNIHAEFRTDVKTFHRSIKKANKQIFSELGYQLFSSLVEPISKHLDKESYLVVIPCGPAE